MKLFTQIMTSAVKSAQRKAIAFPSGEMADLRARLDGGLHIGTTRVMAEKGKYHEGEILDSEFGPLKVLSVVSGQGVGNHPHVDELTSEWKAEIGNEPWDYVELVLAEEAPAIRNLRILENENVEIDRDRMTAKLYHGTSSASARKIEKSGVIRNYPFFTSDIETAGRFARQAGGKPEILALNVYLGDIHPTGGYWTARTERLVLRSNTWRSP